MKDGKNGALTMKPRNIAASCYDFLCCWIVADWIVWQELVWHRMLGTSGQAQADCAASLGHKLVNLGRDAGFPEWSLGFLLEIPWIVLFLAPPLMLSVAATWCMRRHFRSSPGRWTFCTTADRSMFCRIGRIAAGIAGLFAFLVAWTIVVVEFLDPI